MINTAGREIDGWIRSCKEIVGELAELWKLMRSLQSDVEALKASGGYKAETVDMAQLVHAVEGMRPYTVIRTEEYERLLKLEANSTTTDGRCVVPEARILRWEKIERTAKQAIEVTDACGCQDIQVHSHALREALKP